ncbi:ComEC/Rec2 family competence protein [Xanthomonas campestris]|uniref:ComEC/Rec2 family competence protein n=1 Tax=Xanthomonas campestris TaxID=339 RepID=UPI003CF30AC4
MLKFHFLNVGNGDCAIVEYANEGSQPVFGVIDSNKRGQETAPVLRKLRLLGADKLAFVVLTHPHADHFKGLKEVLDFFGDRIDHIFSFPIDRDRARLSKFARAYATALDGAENKGPLEIAGELFAVLLKFVQLNEQSQRWETPVGDGTNVFIKCMPGLDITTVIPHANVKGPFFKSIDDGTSAMHAERHNHLSLALRFSYAGKKIILGGDGTDENWMWVRKRTHSNTGSEFGSANSDAAKLPHHGSAIDCGPLVLDYIFNETNPASDENRRRIAIISANGRSHPSPDVLRDLRRRGIDPYCTGLSRACSPAVALPSVASSTVDPTLIRFIAGVAQPATRDAACQGDITLTILPDGSMHVTPQYSAPCGMRSNSII